MNPGSGGLRPPRSEICHGAHLSQRALMNLEPLEMAAHHWPVLLTRPTKSVVPSLSRSAARTSTQVAPVDQVSHLVVVKAFEPLDTPTYHWPFSKARPTMSALPSPLKSPTLTSTQVAP